MPSTAISAQGSTVSIGTTTGSALTITAVSLTNPCRVTLSAVTALNKGDVITIAGVVGTTQLNGNSFVVQYIEPTTKIVTLAGLDATGYTTYTSGGTATPVQWTKISNVKSYSGFDGSASEIERTAGPDDCSGDRCGQELQVDFAQRQHCNLHCLREEIQQPGRGGSGDPALS